MRVKDIAEYLGERSSTVTQWVRKFQMYGRAGLQEQYGRPPGLDPISVLRALLRARLRTGLAEAARGKVDRRIGSGPGEAEVSTPVKHRPMQSYPDRREISATDFRTAR
jgi:transposase-like protein